MRNIRIISRVLIPCTVGSNPTTPAIICMVYFVFKIVGIKSSRCLEYGCFGLSNNLSLFSNSQIIPFRITATLSHIWRITGRSCDMKTNVKFISFCRSFKRFNMCACTDTSRADVGSSQIRILGREAKALAIETLCL